jgi:hypothetical protein
MKLRSAVEAMAVIFVVMAAADRASALSGGFTYQGRLQQSGAPANGTCDLRFSLYDQAASGTQIGASDLQVGVAVQNGLFTVLVDEPGYFGSAAFDGSDRWLQVDVRCPSGTGSFTTLGPRQQLTATPYAFYTPVAGVADDLVCGGCVGANEIASGAVTSASIASGTIQQSHLAFTPGTVTSITAGTGLTGGTITTSGTIAANIGTAAGTVAAGNHTHAPSYWGLGGNGGTNPVTNFLGTTDNQALELRVNNTRILRLEPNATSPNLIGGFSGNSLGAGVHGATISGGGTLGFANQVTSHYGTVGGGEANTASGEMSTVSGGGNNTAQGASATVAGGSSNTASLDYSTVSGGYSNDASTIYATISGGWDNAITGGGAYGSIGGGRYNTASYEYATIGGGHSNSANANYATISGGGRSSPGDPSTGNRVTDDYGVIGGGGGNASGDGTGATDTATFATVGGGQANTASGSGAAVLGGQNNTASGKMATVGGGDGNSATDDGATVGGGVRNSAAAICATIAGGGPTSLFMPGNYVSQSHGTIGGGGGNRVEDEAGPLVEWYGTVSGGFYNTVTGSGATIGGGTLNGASGYSATIPGGELNTAAGNYSFAAGRKAIADGAGAFVWADSNDKELHAWGANQFVVRAVGGFWLVTAIDADGIPTEGMRLPAGSSQWEPIGAGGAQLSQSRSASSQQLEAENAALKERIEDLEGRLAAVEALLSLGDHGQGNTVSLLEGRP